MKTKTNKPKHMGNLRDEEDWGLTRGTRVYVGAYPVRNLDRTSWIRVSPLDLDDRDQVEVELMTLFSSMPRITETMDPDSSRVHGGHAYLDKRGRLIALAQTSELRTTVVSRVPLRRLSYLGEPLLTATSELPIDPLHSPAPTSTTTTPYLSDSSGLSGCGDRLLN